MKLLWDWISRFGALILCSVGGWAVPALFAEGRNLLGYMSALVVIGLWMFLIDKMGE